MQLLADEEVVKIYVPQYRYKNRHLWKGGFPFEAASARWPEDRCGAGIL